MSDFVYAMEAINRQLEKNGALAKVRAEREETEARIRRLVLALEDLMNQSDELLYQPSGPTFPGGNSWYECRECGATARIFTPCEHDPYCLTDELEKAWREAKHDLRRIAEI